MSDTTDMPLERRPYQKIGFALAPLIAGAMLLSPTPEGLNAAAWATAAVAVLMAVWWATEAIPVPATSLIPMVAFPLLGVVPMTKAAAPYADPVIYLLFGGFVVALGLEKWNLHKRLALSVLSLIGGRPDVIIGGFMGVTAAISMWVSNTAATMVMIPIALSVAAALNPRDGRTFTVALSLGIAYAASIGGLGTLVGTPPNAMLAGYMRRTYGIEIGFGQWMLLGVPVVICMVPLTWAVLTRLAFKIGRDSEARAIATIAEKRAQLGPMSVPEIRMAAVFGLIAFAWCFRPQLESLPGLAQLSDPLIAVLGALALFLIPSGDKARGRFLMDWAFANRLNWGVLLLFGGGLSLAGAVAESGLAAWLGEALAPLAGWHPLLLMAALVTLVIFLTELTSNTATTAGLLPVLGAIATKGEIDPMMLAAPAALAASCAFMLPVATAPNAIIYGSGHVGVPDMVKAGFRINLIGVAVITTLAYLLMPILF